MTNTTIITTTQAITSTIDMPNNLFATPVTYTVGQGSYDLAIGDFNNDGKQDLVVSNTNDNTISVLLGYGDGTFLNQTTYAVGSFPNGVAVGDFNNDGKQDVVTGNVNDNTISVLLGIGNGKFLNQTTYAAGKVLYGASAVAIGDFNNDGKQDVIVTDYTDSTISVLLGNGNGTFLNQVAYATGGPAYGIAVGDFNNDDKLDVVTSNMGDNTISVLLGLGNGKFASQLTYTTGSEPADVAIGDFNNDGKQDVVTSNYNDNTISVLLGYGNGTFVRQVTYAVGMNPWGVAVGDFNNDGKQDVVVNNYEDETISVLLGYGNGTLASQVTYDSDGVYFVAIGDFNNDGKQDVVTADDSNTISVLLNIYQLSCTTTAVPLFANQTTYPTGSGSAPYGIALGDVNSDGKIDAIVANNGIAHNVGVLLGYGNGSFAAQTTYPTGNSSSPIAVVLGDVNLDGKPDIVVTNIGTNNIGVFLNAGNSSFTAQATYLTGNSSSPYGIALGDINLDGKLDIIVANSGSVKNIGNIGILLGYGNGSFATQTTHSMGNSSSPVTVALGDVNLDGKPDMVTNIDNNSIGVCLGYGNGTFAPQLTYQVGTTPYGIVVEDINLDGKPDIIVANYNSNTISVLLGYGNATFAAQTTYSTSTGGKTSPLALALGDVNLDGKPDIVVINNIGYTVGVFLNAGNGTFAPQITYSTGVDSFPRGVVLGDVNLDGKTDVVVANSNNNVGVFLNIYQPLCLTTTSTTTISTIGTTSISTTTPTISTSITAPTTTPTSTTVTSTTSTTASKSTTIPTSPFPNNYIYGLLAAAPSFDTGYYPYAIAIGDLNQDNKSDVVVTNLGLYNNTCSCSISSISVLLGYGNGTFAPQVSYQVGSNYYGLAIGDLNYDGRSDVVVTNGSSSAGKISVLIGNGDGTLQSPISYQVGGGPTGVAIADLNNNRIPDIIVVNSGNGSGNTISVLMGNGNGTFAPQVTYQVGNWPWGVEIGNLNQDSIFDIAVTNVGDGTISVLLGNGDGTLQSQITSSVGDTPFGLAIGNLNNDSIQDIVVANAGDNNISVLIGNGNGTFAPQVTYSTTDTPYGIAIGDLNHDGKSDVVVTNQNSYIVSVLLGNGDGTLQSQITYQVGYQPTGIVIGNFDQDNNLDILVTNKGSNTISVLLGSSNEILPLPVIYQVGSYPEEIATGDLNQDNIPDIIATNWGSNTISVLLGYGDGTLQSQVTYKVGNGPHGVAIGYLNQDDKPDVVVTSEGSNTISVLLGYGNGTLQSQVTYSVGNPSSGSYGSYGVVIGDLNRDNKSDVIITNYQSNAISVFLGYGNGTLQTPISYHVGSQVYTSELAIGDFNMDNIPDLVVVSGNAVLGKISILLGNGDGTLQTPISYQVSNDQTYGIAIGDLNRDNKSDIVVSSWSNTVSILLGNGNGTLQLPIYYQVSNGPNEVAIGDLNLDSKLDIIAVGSGTTAILLGNGDGTFQNKIQFAGGMYGLAISDLNRDNKPDVVSIDYNNVGYIFIALNIYNINTINSTTSLNTTSITSTPTSPNTTTDITQTTTTSTLTSTVSAFSTPTTTSTFTTLTSSTIISTSSTLTSTILSTTPSSVTTISLSSSSSTTSTNIPTSLETIGTSTVTTSLHISSLTTTEKPVLATQSTSLLPLSSTSTTNTPQLITTSNVTITESSHSSSSSDTVMIAAIAGGVAVIAIVAGYIIYKKTHSASVVIPDVEPADNGNSKTLIAHWDPNKYAVGETMFTNADNAQAGNDFSRHIYSIPTTVDTQGNWNSDLYVVASLQNNPPTPWNSGQYAVQASTPYRDGNTVGLRLYDFASSDTNNPYGYSPSITYDNSDL